MRTTLTLEDDAMEDVRAYSERRGISLGKAASELIRNGARYEIGTKRLNGLTVFDVPDDFPVVTSEMVRQLLDEE